MRVWCVRYMHVRCPALYVCLCGVCVCVYLFVCISVCMCACMHSYIHITLEINSLLFFRFICRLYDSLSVLFPQGYKREATSNGMCRPGLKLATQRPEQHGDFENREAQRKIRRKDIRLVNIKRGYVTPSHPSLIFLALLCARACVCLCVCMLFYDLRDQKVFGGCFIFVFMCEFVLFASFLFLESERGTPHSKGMWRPGLKIATQGPGQNA